MQLGYGWAMLTPPLALKALDVQSADGVITNNIIELFDRLTKPTFDEQVAGTKLFFRELNRLALTGVVDPGGNNVTPREYQALFKVWRDRQLTLRVVYSLCGMTNGSEFAEYQNYLAMMPQGFGDDMLHFKRHRRTNHEDKRGSLEVGKLADLAVLSKDYMTVTVEQIGGIESQLTMVGGQVVYAAGPFNKFEGVR